MFLSLSDDNKFLWLMTPEDSFVIEKLACHILTCFGNRKISSSSRLSYSCMHREREREREREMCQVQLKSNILKYVAI